MITTRSRNLHDDFVTEIEKEKQWTAPEALLILLHDPSLKTRDKVELVIGTYALMNRGLHPSAEKVGRVLGISKNRVLDVMTQLKACGRIEKIDGKYFLKNGFYQNPTVSKLLSELGYETPL